MSKIEFQNKVMIIEDKVGSELLRKARKAADSDASVLICGESGTGKELVARFIHTLGKGEQRPFVAVNCSALPEGMMEAELFGFEKGAFTGALYQRIGKMEQAAGGTLLLDEVTEMPVSIQAKLLRALQEREIDRLGGKNPIPVDVRVIATSNKDPMWLIEKGGFRADLFYRLNVLRLDCHPLRGRIQALTGLIKYFIEINKQKYDRPELLWNSGALELLKEHSWPGNIRELSNVIERATVLCENSEIYRQDLLSYLEVPQVQTPLDLSVETLEDLERQQIKKAIQRTKGNKTQAARNLGISVRTLHNKLKIYGQCV